MSKQLLTQLIQESIVRGASLSAVISSNDIQVREELAALCDGEYVCPNYGVAAGCPPHVKGPCEFRKWQARSEYSVVVKIEIPTSVMFSSAKNEIMQLLHHVVSGVELKAVEIGYTQSRGFAGGSCKELFCNDHKGCAVVDDDEPCRHLEVARPSMSGFGIDVIHLMEAAGWSAPVADKNAISDNDAMSWVAGLILLA